tara:strand:- start:556 stop:834 length:279 start_codon:yes stop_codon:yes gene_type:complete
MLTAKKKDSLILGVLIDCPECGEHLKESGQKSANEMINLWDYPDVAYCLSDNCIIKEFDEHGDPFRLARKVNIKKVIGSYINQVNLLKNRGS